MEEHTVDPAVAEKLEKVKKELIEKGKKKGVLSFKEVVAAFSEIEVNPEEIEAFYDVLEQEKIELAE